FFFSSRRRHTRFSRDWSSDVCSSDLITAGGCLGIMIPPSVLLIVYGAVAGVSVVKLYAGAFFPGLMLALLYVLYIMIVAKVSPRSEERRVGKECRSRGAAEP